MQSVKILFVEDNNHDVELLVRHLEKNGFTLEYDTVETLKDLKERITNETYEICICDFGFPNFSGIDALKLVGNEKIDLPVILVSGTVLDEQAIEALLAGAKDYVLKGNLTRLVPAIKRELDALAYRKEKAKTDRLLQAVFDSPIGVRVSDEERIIVKVNEAFCQMMGYSEEELIGSSINEMIPKTRIERDTFEYQNFINNYVFGEYIRTGSAKRDIRKDGSYIDVYVKSKVIKDEGDKKLVVSTFQDVSEVFKYKTLFEESGRIAKLGGWEYNLTTKKEAWTQQVFQIFGVSEEDFNPGINEFKHFYVNGSLETAQKAMKNAMHGQAFDIEIQIKDANGNLKWCRATGIPLFENNEVVKIIGSFQDITDSKIREIQIRESQRNYKFLFEKSPNPMLIFDKETKIVQYSNVASERLYGYSKEEFLELKQEVIYKNIEDYDKSWVSNKENGDKINSVLGVTHITKSGKEIVVNVFSRTLELYGEKAAIFVINDVTEKHKYEQELIRTNNLLKALIKKAPIGVITVNEFGCVDDIWNPQAEQIFGWSKNEVLGKRLPYVPDVKLDEFNENLKKGSKDKKSFVTEIERVHKNGATIQLKEFVTPISDEEGKFSKIMLLVEDITEKKQVENSLIKSEEKYRNLVEASHDIIWRMDADGNFTFMNNASKAILGFSPEDFIGNSFQDYIYPEKLDETIIIHNRVNAGEVIENFPLQMLTSNGEPRHLEGTAYPIINDDGVIIGCAGTATDITHLTEYQSQLEESLKEKEILIREIHHRVKNNLAVISGLFALQTLQVKDEGVLTILKESQFRIKSIATIHEKLYQNDRFSSIEMKGYLRDLVKEISDTYTRDDREVGIDIVGDDVFLNVNQAVPFGILANELIINAYKYAFEHKEKGTITLALNEKNNTVKFTVQDNGAGLPVDFDINNLDSLGMTLVKTLAQQLKAEFTWNTELGKGVAFTIEFQPSLVPKSTWLKKPDKN